MFTLPLWYTFPKSSTGGIWILNGVEQFPSTVICVIRNHSSCLSLFFTFCLISNTEHHSTFAFDVLVFSHLFWLKFSFKKDTVLSLYFYLCLLIQWQFVNWRGSVARWLSSRLWCIRSLIPFPFRAKGFCRPILFCIRMAHYSSGDASLFCALTLSFHQYAASQWLYVIWFVDSIPALVGFLLAFRFPPTPKNPFVSVDHTSKYSYPF